MSSLSLSVTLFTSIIQIKLIVTRLVMGVRMITIMMMTTTTIIAARTPRDDVLCIMFVNIVRPAEP